MDKSCYWARGVNFRNRRLSELRRLRLDFGDSLHRVAGVDEETFQSTDYLNQFAGICVDQAWVAGQFASKHALSAPRQVAGGAEMPLQDHAAIEPVAFEDSR